MTEYALQVAKNNRSESRHKTCSVVVGFHVVWVVMVDGHQRRGLITRGSACQRDGIITLHNGASPTVFHLVTIIPQASTSPVALLNLHQNARVNASKVTKHNTRKTYTLQKMCTRYQKMGKKYRHRS